MATQRGPAKHNLFNELAISGERVCPLKIKWGSQGSIRDREPIADRGHENPLLPTGDHAVPLGKALRIVGKSFKLSQLRDFP